MKTFTSISILVLVAATAGILSQHGKANTVSYLSCAPLAAWVVVLLVAGVRGTLGDWMRK